MSGFIKRPIDFIGDPFNSIPSILGLGSSIYFYFEKGLLYTLIPISLLILIFVIRGSYSFLNRNALQVLYNKTEVELSEDGKNAKINKFTKIKCLAKVCSNYSNEVGCDGSIEFISFNPGKLDSKNNSSGRSIFNFRINPIKRGDILDCNLTYNFMNSFLEKTEYFEIGTQYYSNFSEELIVKFPHTRVPTIVRKFKCYSDKSRNQQLSDLPHELNKTDDCFQLVFKVEIRSKNEYYKVEWDW